MGAAATLTLIVKGKGDGTGSHGDNGGGYTDNYVGTVVDMQGDDGAHVAGVWGGSQTSVNMTDSGQQYGLGYNVVRLTAVSPGDKFYNKAHVGILMNIETIDGTYSDDRYEVLANGDDWADIKLQYVSDSTCDALGGGALPLMQTAFDLTPSSQATDILLCQNVDVTGTTIFYHRGNYTTDKFVQFIGTDANGVELTTGNYRVVDAGGNDLSGPIFKATSILNGCMRFKHIHAYNADKTQSDNAGWEMSLPPVGGSYGIEWINCKASEVYTGWDIDDTRVRACYMRDCVGSDCTGLVIDAGNAGGLVMDDCLIKGASQAALVDYGSGFGFSCNRCVFVGGQYAFNFTAGAGTVPFSGCVFYGQSVAGIKLNKALLGLSVNDCIFMPLVGASDYGVEYVAGYTHSSDHNNYWSVDGVECLNYSGIAGANDIAADPLFVDADNDDFTLGKGSPCIGAGRADIGDGERDIGPVAFWNATSAGYPAEAVVTSGVDYGHNDQLTGTLDVTEPNAPVFTIEAGTNQVTLTIDGDADVTNYARYRGPSDTDWVAGGNRSGDGTITVTGLDNNVPYVFEVYSVDVAGNSSLSGVSKIVTLAALVVNDTDEAYLLAARAQMEAHGENVTFWPGGGDVRQILAIVDRAEAEDLDGPHGHTPVTYIYVVNSSVDGISASEFDGGVDQVELSVRRGEVATKRNLVITGRQEHGMVKFEVQ
jgi:hypothetical protein